MNRANKYLLIPLGLLSMTALSGVLLMSSSVNADNDSVVDEINITVPVSCTMSGSGMTSHNASIANGTYNSNIGETTITTFCNDNSGFAIYAIGYTDDTDGKNVLTDSVDTNNDIATGTATEPVGGNDNSNWAMKLSTVTSPIPTYPITIQNSFDPFHTVPDDYALVAKRTEGTDVGQNAEGSTIKSTYQAYISKTQPAGTYTGQVKYVMVHPSTELPPVDDDQIGVIYDGNGQFFDQAGTRSTNRVVYEESCEDEYGYIADTPLIMKTRNLNADGTQNGPYSYDGSTWYEGDGLDPNYIEIEDASKVKIVVNYSLTQGASSVFNINVNGFSIDNMSNEIYDDSINRSGTITYTSDAGGAGYTSSVSIYSELGGNPTATGYDYGYYVQVYPIYDEPTEGATYGIIQNTCSYQPIIGAYTETTTWNGVWYIPTYDNATFYNESGVVEFLKENEEELYGTTIHLYSANTYTIYFDANGGIGSMDPQEAVQYSGHLDYHQFSSSLDFIGWNTEPDGSGISLYENDWLGEPLADAGESITLYAQWGCRAYNICYSGNGNDGDTIMSKSWAGSSTVTLFASEYSRTGYGFAGWNTEPDGSGTLYGPSETIPVTNSIRNNGLILYANWVQSTGNLQTWSGCSGMTTGSITALTDLRDNNTYAISKINSGDCLMMENLRTNPATANITASNTNNPTATFLANRSNATTDFCNTYTQECVNKDIYQAGEVFLYGYYYNWYTATAGNGQYASSTDQVLSANGDICPAGWKVPRAYAEIRTSLGLTDTEYTSASNPTGNEVFNMLTKPPYNFVRSWCQQCGWLGGSSFYYGSGAWNSYNDIQGQFGTYSHYVKSLYFYDQAVYFDTNFSLGSHDRLYTGAPIRCIKDNI